MNKKLILAVLFFSLFNNKAFAYLDPGTGGIIVQAIFGIIAGIITFYYLLKQKIKIFFQKIVKIFKRSKKDD